MSLAPRVRRPMGPAAMKKPPCRRRLWIILDVAKRGFGWAWLS